MTLLRRNLFGFLAACTSLAVGIALGGGPLQGHFVDTGFNANSSGRSSAPRTNTNAGLRLAGAVTSALSPWLLHNRLSGRSVAVFALPGVPATTVNGLVAAVQKAGGLTPVVAHLAPGLVDPRKKTYIDSVASGSLRHRPDISANAGHDTYSRMGAVLARAYVGRNASSTFDPESRGIDAELQGANVITLKQAPVRRGSLVVVLAPRTVTTGPYAAATRVIITLLVKALAQASDGAVLVAPGAGRGRNRAAATRKHGGIPLSVVNVSMGSGGAVVAIYALTAAVNGHPGRFGVFGKAVALPPGLAASGL